MLAPGTIPVQFFEAVARFQDRVAFQIKRDGRYVQLRYGEVADQAHRLASFLIIRLQVAPGDRIALLSENRPEWCVAYLGIVAAGATAVPLDGQMEEQELETLLQHSDSRVLVVSEAEFTRVESLIGRLSPRPEVILLDEKGSAGVHFLSEILQSTSKESLPSLSQEALASILYTSGTTGSPKGVMLNHGNFISNSLGLRDLNVVQPEDNVLALLPLHHVYPFMTTFLTPLLSGAQVTFLQSLKSPDLLQCMKETGVTILVAVPQLLALLHRGILQEVKKQPWLARTLFSIMLGMVGASRKYLGGNPGPILFPQIHHRFGGKLRILTSGGAKLDPVVGRDLNRLGFTVLEGYGLTETSPAITFTPMTRPRFESVGLPLPGVRVRIMDPDADGVGEIAVQGPNVMQGYFKDPAETAMSFRDGWFLSGDLGYLDSDGYLLITGRSKEVIIPSTGKNIYPEEVEAHYLKSPYIKEVCLLGIDEPGETRTEGIAALVVPDFDYLKAQRVANSEEMIRWEMENLSRELPAYKRPTRLHIVREAFPRTRLGKIQRHLVRQTHLEREIFRPKVAERSPPTEADQALVQTPVAQKIVSSLTVLGRKKEETHLDDNLELDLGLDSLTRIELVVALEEQFGIALPAETGSELFTVRDVVLKVQEHLEQRPEAVEKERESRRPPWKEILAGEPPERVQAEIVTGRKPWALAVTLFSKLILRLVFKLLCRFRVYGLEHVPDRGPYLITPNHCSYVDG
ncbi:MAG: AMP-binding protein, partial [Candidatus Methylomirabilales bacterium]